MAIRPIDLQGVIANASQTAPLARQGEEAATLAQANAQASHVAKLEERTETIHESERGHGNKVNPEGEREQGQPGKKRKRNPGEPFDDVLHTGTAGIADDEPHFIDFSA